MWAIIPVRWPTTPASHVWSAAQFAAFLNPNISFSLGQYLRRVTFGQVDLDYHLFNPVVMQDPRVTKPDVPDVYSGEREDRKLLLNAPRHEVSQRDKPDWSTYFGIMFWFAQSTDAFGGTSPPACVVDRTGRFDLICHEVLHMFGFSHTSDGVNEYVSPYDIMSAQSYTLDWPGPTFERPANPAFPVGSDTAPDPTARVGPLLSPAQLARSTYWPSLDSSGLVRTLPEDLSRPVRVRLHAVDLAAKQWPTVNGPVVAQTAELGQSGERFYVEFRRSAGYDAGLIRADPAAAAAANRPPAGVVVHHQTNHGRLDYVGVLPLLNEGDLDATFLEHALRFSVKLNGVGPADAWVDVEIRRQTGVPTGHALNLDVEITDEDRGTGNPIILVTKPCFAGPKGAYTLFTSYTRSGFQVTATSLGYSKPRYAWRLNGSPIDPNLTWMSLQVPTVVPDGKGGWRTEEQAVRFEYRLRANLLSVSCEPAQLHSGVERPTGNFNIPLEVTVAESDPGVIKNHYPPREVVTNLHFRTVSLDWDAAYRRAEKRCQEMLEEVLRKRIPEHGLPRDLDPSWGRVREEFNHILQTDPVLARAVTADLARALDQPSSTVLAELGGSRLRSPWLAAGPGGAGGVNLKGPG